MGVSWKRSLIKDLVLRNNLMLDEQQGCRKISSQSIGQSSDHSSKGSVEISQPCIELKIQDSEYTEIVKTDKHTLGVNQR